MINSEREVFRVIEAVIEQKKEKIRMEEERIGKLYKLEKKDPEPKKTETTSPESEPKTSRKRKNKSKSPSVRVDLDAPTYL